MALQVWLPLNGDLHNQGLDASLTAMSGTPSWLTYGKISNIGLSMSSRLTGTSNAMNGAIKWSVCFWFNTASSTTLTDNWVDLCGMTDISTGGTSGQFRFEACYGSSLRACSWHDNATNATINGSVTIAVDNEKNTWHHACVTTDGTNVKTYKDGVLIHTYTTGVGGHLNGYFWLGETNKIVGCIQDFRLYDHVLSNKEVKEISKGLVLNYKLDNNGFGGENLLPCGGTYVKNSCWTTTLNRTDGYAWVTNSAFEGTPSTAYTISVECDGTLSSSHGANGISIANKPWSFWAYVCNTNTSKSWSTGAYDRAINLTSANNNYRKIGNAHVWTITLSSTEKYISLRTNSYSDGNTNLTINWWNMKVELGNNFTGWSPNLSSSLANSLKLNDNIIYDSSGYNHNGTLVNTGINSSSPRHMAATSLIGEKPDSSSNTLTGAQYLYGVLPLTTPSAITVTWWAKIDTYGRGGIFETTGSADLAFGADYNTTAIANWDSTFRIYNGSSNMDFMSNFSRDGIWHYRTIVFNGTNAYYYQDGELKKSGALSGTLPTMTGFRMGLGRAGGVYRQIVQQVSDLRIYTTALSADDIKELYKTSKIVSGTTVSLRSLE